MMKKEAKKEGLVSIFKKKYQELDREFKSKQEELDSEVRGMMLTMLETKTNYIESVDMDFMENVITSIVLVLQLSRVDHNRWCYCLSELLGSPHHCFESLLIDVQLDLINLGNIPSDYEKGLLD